MAYLPGYTHDIFLSYAHGDNRVWVERLIERLKDELPPKVGGPVDIFVDDESVRRSTDYRPEIPEKLQASGIFLFLPSPYYVRSGYCVDVECSGFERSLPSRRERFRNPTLRNSKFAIRCPILPIENRLHERLLPGLTDIPFCDQSATLPVGTPAFEVKLSELVGELKILLTLMRNDATSVYVCRGEPREDVEDAYKTLTKELDDQGYRVLPETRIDLEGQFRSADLSVFLMGRKFSRETKSLTTIAERADNRPWVLWRSPEADAIAEPNQLFFLDELSRIGVRTKIDLGQSQNLRREVIDLLKPDPIAIGSVEGKPRVYVVFKEGSRAEALKAGQITSHYEEEFQFDFAGDRSAHTRRLSSSDGVLLVWGAAEEDWCAQEFDEIVRVSQPRAVKALCVFDPKAEKQGAIESIRNKHLTNVHIAEMYGSEFNPRSVEPFFTPIRQFGRNQGAGA